MKTQRKKQSGSDFIQASKTYHCFNRTNNKELLFKSGEDHIYFLETINRYLSPFVDFIAYALIPNHFHFQYKVKTIGNIIIHLNGLKESKRCITEEKFLDAEQREDEIDRLICNQFRRAFIAYAYYVNKKYKRKGNLFYKNLKTKELDTPGKKKIVQRYIHCNTIKHNMDIHPKDNPWCSYNDCLLKSKGLINKKLSLGYFSSTKDFIEFHSEYIQLHASFLLKKNEVQTLEEELFPSF